MTGKQQCEAMRKIRKQIADMNGIIYPNSECDYKGECTGECAVSQAEIDYLDREISKLIKDGKKVITDDSATCLTEKIYTSEHLPYACNKDMVSITKKDLPIYNSEYRKELLKIVQYENRSGRFDGKFEFNPLKRNRYTYKIFRRLDEIGVKCIAELAEIPMEDYINFFPGSTKDFIIKQIRFIKGEE